jgi:hypothetical protein
LGLTLSTHYCIFSLKSAKSERRELMDIEQLQEFFFQAALVTWAGNGEKTIIPDLPQAKVFVYKDGEFRYVDLYYVSAWGQQSFGQTTIWYDGTPVWGMQFGGYYPEDVIAFLKAALQETYKQRLFCGGRGNTRFEQGNLLYTNRPAPNDFTDFAGIEGIFRKDSNEKLQIIGRHWYRGYSLM